MAKQKNERVIFRATRFTMVKHEETGEKVKTYSSTEKIPSMYIHYDEKGSPSQKVYSLRMDIDKTGKPVPVAEDIWLSNGHLEVVLPQGKTLVDFMMDHPNRDTPENRTAGRKIIFERVDISKEKAKDVSGQDLIVEAFNLIASSNLIDLMEYGRALGLDVSEVEELMASSGKKNQNSVKGQECVMDLIVDLKRHAAQDAKNFINGLNDPLRGALAVIKDGVGTNVLTFDTIASQYCWRVGNDRTPIINVPQGVPHEKWFAQWLTENKPTLEELQSRIDLSKKAVDTQ